jgi:hypothetical protein
MKSAGFEWNAVTGLHVSDAMGPEAGLALYFASRDVMEAFDLDGALRARFPNARLVGCTTGGQIIDGDVSDVTVSGVALAFDRTPVRVAAADIGGMGDSFALGGELGRQLAADDLAGVLVLSDGLAVNGTRLVAGLTPAVGPGVAIAGGLAGDGARFERTLVAADGPARAGQVAAIGFYGRHVRLGHGVGGGWDVFGPRRKVTRSDANVLFELDGEPALDLYERYLGPEDSAALPGSALLFPLMLRDPVRPTHEVIRTVLAVDRTARSMTFAGDIPAGWSAQLMRGRFERLTGAAGLAARAAAESLGTDIAGDRVAVLVSCIGRRLLMGQHVTDELEAARDALAGHGKVVGFYSYGEISPHAASGMCELHNQSMTVTSIAEAA